MDRTKTGALIAAARKEQNMTQKELAAALHVSDRAVSKWERGESLPDVYILSQIADLYGVSVSALTSSPAAIRVLIFKQITPNSL